MRIETGTLILESKDCTTCDDERTPVGTIVKSFTYKVCQKCKGTGMRGRGRCRECNERNGYFSTVSPRKPGYVPDYSQIAEIETCPSCGGNPHNAMMEDLTDYINLDIIRALPFEVRHRDNARQTFNQAYLGIGTVYSVTDYGRYRTQTDEEIIERVKDGLNPQACNYVDRDTLELCKEIVILTNNNGYSAYASWE